MKTAIAYLQSALQDAKLYIDIAPADDRLLRAIIHRYLILYTAIKGPTNVEANMKSLQPIVKRLRLVERISKQVWSDVMPTTARQSWTMMQKWYARGADSWDAIFAQRDIKEADRGEAIERPAMDGLDELVERLVLHGPELHLEADEKKWTPHRLNPVLDEHVLEL